MNYTKNQIFAIAAVFNTTEEHAILISQLITHYLQHGIWWKCIYFKGIHFKYGITTEEHAIAGYSHGLYGSAQRFQAFKITFQVNIYNSIVLSTSEYHTLDRSKSGPKVKYQQRGETNNYSLLKFD